ncbi:MAG: hypothetical protein BGO40_06775 [Chryseobacterium sp. 39-10]|nr:hypothetical protein [Chryseobacterium sp.]OJV47987.1 MAG: hypothetical protein BGO40_06775 [Chryseobacterium sp. 39-10]
MVAVDSPFLLFGIVVYREKFWESVSFKTLLQSFQSDAHRVQNLSIFIFDNTDIDGWNVQHEMPIFHGVDLYYFHDQSNPGLAKAYNKIAEYAYQNHIAWMILLDQDTTLPKQIYNLYSEAAENTSIKIKVPQVFSADQLISPSAYKAYRSFQLQKVDPIMKLHNLSCINSGMMIDVTFFRQIGGYNSFFKLDFCDHDFIEKVKKYTPSIGILPARLQQNFSSEVHTKEQALTRYKMYVRDLKIYYQNRNPFLVFFMVDAPHLLKLILTYKSLTFFAIRF